MDFSNETFKVSYKQTEPFVWNPVCNYKSVLFVTISLFFYIKFTMSNNVKLW